MAGSKSGVATRFKEENEKRLLTHCYGHALNLAIVDAIKKVLTHDTFSVTYEILQIG